MGIFSKFEDRMEDTVEGAASRMSKAPISPVQIAKKAEKQMRRETMVGAGKEYAPTLYTVLVNPDDDERLFGYYPTLAGETETYLSAKAAQDGLVMDGNPLVRFIVDDALRHGKFEVIAEVVAAPIVAELRQEEMERYGLAVRSTRRGPEQQPGQGQQQPGAGAAYGAQAGAPQQAAYGYEQQVQQPYGYEQYQQQPVQPISQPRGGKPPLPYVPEEEIDRSIDYGEYTFNSADFEDYRNSSEDAYDAPVAYNDAFNGQNGFAPYGQQAAPAGPGAQQAQRQMQPANTVAFASGNQAAGNQAAPDRRTVRARLIDHTYQRPYDLAGTRFTIGREVGNDIPVQDINASRRHAELSLNQQGLWVVTDLGSMNGTLVNGVSVASQPLYPGDIVTIGKTDFEFTLV